MIVNPVIVPAGSGLFAQLPTPKKSVQLVDPVAVSIGTPFASKLLQVGTSLVWAASAPQSSRRRNERRSRLFMITLPPYPFCGYGPRVGPRVSPLLPNAGCSSSSPCPSAASRPSGRTGALRCVVFLSLSWFARQQLRETESQ